MRRLVIILEERLEVELSERKAPKLVLGHEEHLELPLHGCLAKGLCQGAHQFPEQGRGTPIQGHAEQVTCDVLGRTIERAEHFGVEVASRRSYEIVFVFVGLSAFRIFGPVFGLWKLLRLSYALVNGT